MVDAVAILPPGWRAFDNSGNLITDGVLSFFDAGTSNPKTVFADATLSTPLGATVNCNSAGYPVTSGNSKTLIYTGSVPYKIRLSSVILGGTIFEHDNVLGALDTSDFLTEAAVADQTLVQVVSNRAVTAADKGKFFNVDTTASDITLTFDDASDLGSGFFIGVRAGGINAVIISGNGTDVFSLPGTVTTRYALNGIGQSHWLTCDGTGFVSHSESPPIIRNTQGMLVIADRLSAPPVSPSAGARYIVTAGPSGAWSAFSEGDIAEAAGGGAWFRIAISSIGTNKGILAFVQDEQTLYQYKGSAWGSTELQPATQAQMETPALTTVYSSPARQHFHFMHPKAGGRWNGTGTPAFNSEFGMGAITDNGVGNYTLNLDTAFSSTNNFWAVGNSEDAVIFGEFSRTTSSYTVTTVSHGGSSLDRASNGVTFWGDYV